MVTKSAMVVAAMLFALPTGIDMSAGGRLLLAKFDGGIGTQPVGSLVPSPIPGAFPTLTQNVVRGVVPAPGPWTIASLRAEVDDDSSITVRGKGLLLAGGDRLGQSLQLAVAATLICDAQPRIEHTTTTLVQLDTSGDFRIDDTLAPAVPAECANPVLLIRSGFTGPWLAAGIPDRRDD